MKFIKVGAIIVLALILFSGVYLTGTMTSEKLTKEISIGYANSEYAGQIDNPTIITDAQDQAVIDNFLMIYLYSKQTEDVMIDNDHPDLYITLSSSRSSTGVSIGLIDSKVWFTTEGAVIGKRSGESWEQVDYSIINQDDADYIKKQAKSTGVK
jgi:hypothetical protein